MNGLGYCSVTAAAASRAAASGSTTPGSGLNRQLVDVSAGGASLIRATR